MVTCSCNKFPFILGMSAILKGARRGRGDREIGLGASVCKDLSSDSLVLIATCGQLDHIA